ncbi:MAG TPA: nitroreductase family protein [Terriglobia bacterium]|jgi:nitroreductase
MDIESDVLNVMGTMRAMRRLKPDAISDDLIHKILRAAIAAPNAGNRQKWRFVIVKDRSIKQRVQHYYKKALDEYIAPQYKEDPLPAGVTRQQYDRQFSAVEYLTDHFHEAPVWIVACLDRLDHPETIWSGASIYPAVQNILIAARALGLGAVLTTRHTLYSAEVDAILEIPPGARSYAIIPIGYPMGSFGPVQRRPLKDVVYLDRWGAAYSKD